MTIQQIDKARMAQGDKVLTQPLPRLQPVGLLWFQSVRPYRQGPVYLFIDIINTSS